MTLDYVHTVYNGNEPPRPQRIYGVTWKNCHITHADTYPERNTYASGFLSLKAPIIT